MALKARATPPICGKHISRPMKLIKKPRTSETDVSVNLRGHRLSFDNIKHAVKRTMSARVLMRFSRHRSPLPVYDGATEIAAVEVFDYKFLGVKLAGSRNFSASFDHLFSDPDVTTTTVVNIAEDTTLASFLPPSPSGEVIQNVLGGLNGLSAISGTLDALSSRVALAVSCSQPVLSQLQTIRSCASSTHPARRARPAADALAREMRARAAEDSCASVPQAEGRVDAKGASKWKMSGNAFAEMLKSPGKASQQPGKARRVVRAIAGAPIAPALP